MTTVRGMGTIAAKYWWVLLVRGILLVQLGIAMIAWPQATVTVFVVLFAAYLFVDGVMNIFQGFSERKAGEPSSWSFISGVLAIAFGIVVLAWPDTMATVFVSSSPSGRSGRHRRHCGWFAAAQKPGSGWVWFLAWGVLAGIFGIVLMVNPAPASLACCGWSPSGRS